MRNRDWAKIRNHILTALTEQGFSVGDAERWAITHTWEDASTVVRLAVHFRQSGFTTSEAIAWARESFAAHPAAILASAGWTPEQSQVLYWHFPKRCTVRQWDEIPDARIREWICSGIPPEWCLLYLDAGCDLNSAKALEERRRHGEDLRTALVTLAALRQDDDATWPVNDRTT